MQETPILGYTPTTFMFFPLIGLITVWVFFALFCYRRYQNKEPIPLGSIAWPVAYTSILAFLAAWCAAGFVSTTETYWIFTSALLTLGGCLVSVRERVFAAFDRFERRSKAAFYVCQVARIARDVAIMFIAAEFARLALELPSNESVFYLNSNSVVIELSILFLVALTGYFLFQRTAAGPTVMVVCAFFAGIAEYFVVLFKQNAILPMELMALQTAADVGDQYSYTFSTSIMHGFVYAALALVLVAFIRPQKIRGRRLTLINAAANVCLALICASAVNWWFTTPNYHDDLGYTISYWNSPNTYRKQGILPSFLTALEDMPIKEPDNYHHSQAQNLIDTWAVKAQNLPGRRARRKLSESQFRDITPSVVFVMNESFSDLSRLDNLRCDYEGPQFFKSMDDTLRRGQLAVSVYGAGTCNSEFEVLTANSLAFVGAGKYPYQMFDLSETDNLARQFKDMGYKTLAIHPNQGDNWNRNVVYKDLGFDKFISCDNDFEGEPGFHNGFTDRVTYDRILKALSDERNPYFIFDVTMQNHGGYQIGNIPADRLTNYQPKGFSAEDLGKLNEFLSCIQASDEDLAWFVGELEKLDRPVVLVFFGDHHPVISATYNDVFFDVAVEGEMDHQGRVYQTDYFIWANYDVEGCDQTSEVEQVGTDCLGALTLDLIGAPLDEFQAAQLGIHTRLPEISSIGYSGPDGHWHAPGTSPYLAPIYQQMAHMDYLRFGEGVQ